MLYNVLAWTSWLLFIPLIWRLASAVRIRRERFVRPTCSTLAASLMLAAVVCVISGFEQYWVMVASGITQAAGQPLAPAFNLKRVFLYTFEWKVLLYWGVVGVHHAIYYAHALGDRELREARLEARLVEARLEPCNGSCIRISCSTRCMRSPGCCTATPTPPSRCWCGWAISCARCSAATRSRRCRSAARSS